MDDVKEFGRGRRFGEKSVKAMHSFDETLAIVSEARASGLITEKRDGAFVLESNGEMLSYGFRSQSAAFGYWVGIGRPPGVKIVVSIDLEAFEAALVRSAVQSVVEAAQKVVGGVVDALQARIASRSPTPQLDAVEKVLDEEEELPSAPPKRVIH